MTSNDSHETLKRPLWGNLANVLKVVIVLLVASLPVLCIMDLTNSSNSKEYSSLNEVETALDRIYEYRELIVDKPDRKMWMCWVRQESLEPHKEEAILLTNGKWSFK